MASGRLIDYLGIGLASARPASLNLFSGALGLYYATDTSQFSCWNGSAWVTPTVAASAAWGSITGTLSSQADLQAALTARAVLAAANAFTAQQTVTPYRANITGAVSIDLSATAKSNNLYLTLTGNVTSFALTNPVDGGVYNIRFIQDATGGRTMPALPASFKFSSGTAPTFTTTANAVDFMSLLYGGTEATYMCSFLSNMS